MARVNTIRPLKTTKANLDTQATANNLKDGEMYFISDLNRLAVGTGVNTYVYTSIRGVSGYYGGKPVGSQIIMSARAPYAFSLLQANCSIELDIAATASTVFAIKNGVTTIGTGTVAAAGTVATMSISTPAIAKGNRITVVGPASADATAAGITMLFTE